MSDCTASSQHVIDTSCLSSATIYTMPTARNARLAGLMTKMKEFFQTKILAGIKILLHVIGED